MAAREHQSQLDGATVNAVLAGLGIRTMVLTKKVTNEWTAKGPQLERDWTLQHLEEMVQTGPFPWIVTLSTGEIWKAEANILALPNPSPAPNRSAWVGAVVTLQLPRLKLQGACTILRFEGQMAVVTAELAKEVEIKVPWTSLEPNLPEVPPATPPPVHPLVGLATAARLQIQMCGGGTSPRCEYLFSPPALCSPLAQISFQPRSPRYPGLTDAPLAPCPWWATAQGTQRAQMHPHCWLA
jgi:hypothetical protein